MYLKALCISVLLWTLSCGAQDKTIDIVYDPCQPMAVIVEDDLSDARIDSIHQSVQLWNQLAHSRIYVVKTSAGEAVEAKTHQKIRLYFESAAPLFHGIYRDEKGDIVINTSLRDTYQRAIIAAHELGHAFGLKHVKHGTSSVMTKNNLATPPTSQDAIMLERLWGECPPPMSSSS